MATTRSRSKSTKKPLTAKGRRTESRLPSNRARQREIAELKELELTKDRKLGKQLDEQRAAIQALKEKDASQQKTIDLLTQSVDLAAKALVSVTDRLAALEAK